MSKRELPGHKRKRRLWPVLLLALLCIGVAELIACRFFAPALYQRITSPVRQSIHAAAEFGGRTVSQVSAWWSARAAPEEAPPESYLQIAGEPMVVTDTARLDPSLTELKTVGDREILTGGVLNIVYFNQGEEPWSDQPYGSDNIGRYGCGPTAMAMAVASMTELDSDPAQMAQWAVDHKHWAKHAGSYLSIVNGAAREYGLWAEPLKEYTPEAIQEALLSGHLLVALMGPGHFTNSGHFILLRGVTLSGQLLVADPNSEERSLMEWEPQLILEELSSSTSNGAPLWVLSKGNS